MKESKKLFTKCISEMNSERKRVEGERSNNVSMTENSKQMFGQCKSGNKKEQYPVTSFKALKIQMIESVLPEDKCTTEKKMVDMSCKRDSNKGEIAVCHQIEEVRDFQLE